jgi:CubicO group peptidase (beta-lactamase class C family)
MVTITAWRGSTVNDSGETDMIGRLPRSVLLLLAGLAGGLNTAANPVAAAAAAPPVDAVFAEYDRDDVPGCALGVIRDGEFVYRRGYGMANLEHSIPISPSSVFRIGSTSKQFTAAAVALLAQTGVLSLDDPLRRYFLEFPHWAEGITIRQLIHHTSGIRDYLQLAFLAGKGGDADHYTDEWVIGLLARQQETNFPPGTRHLYSNSGYLLLAHLVRRVTGRSLRRYAHEHIFEPLGMTGTHFHDDHTGIVPGRATGYAPVEGTFRISMTTLDMVGDGGVFTSVDELLAWDRNFYANRLRGGQELIARLTTPGRLLDGNATHYAFGLGVDHWRGLARVSHGGAFVGYRAELMRFPEERFSVAVLCNRADANPTALAEQVAAHYLADRIAPEPERAATGEVTPLPAEALERYAGDFWEAEEAFAAESRVVDGKLWAIHSPTRRNELVPVGPDRFRMIGVPGEVIVQYTLDNGRVTGLTRTIDGQERGRFTPFERRRVTPDQLTEYIGDYYSPELDIVYRLARREDSLHFALDTVPPQELTAMFDEIFENPDYGSFQFVRDSDRQITGFRLQSGRVRNLLFHRQ